MADFKMTKQNVANPFRTQSNVVACSKEAKKNKNTLNLTLVYQNNSEECRLTGTKAEKDGPKVPLQW